MIEASPGLWDRLTEVAGYGSQPFPRQSWDKSFDNLMRTDDVKRKWDAGIKYFVEIFKIRSFIAGIMNDRWTDRHVIQSGRLLNGCQQLGPDIS
jgi:hypothetical protein